MKLNDYINKIATIHEMIESGEANPDYACNQLGISQATFYNYLKEMRNMGAPIIWKRSQGRYKYAVPVNFNFGFKYKST